jgi:hypothetical protein
MTTARAINPGNTANLLPLAQDRRTVPNHRKYAMETVAGNAGQGPETGAKGLMQAAWRPGSPEKAHPAPHGR